MKRQNSPLNTSWSTGQSVTSPNYFKETPFNWTNSNQGLSSPMSSQTSISNSYNRMGGKEVGSLGGRMEGLEKASMRLQAQKAKEEADRQAREFFYNQFLK